MNNKKPKIIIDTDTAGDDTIAILTALHNFEVLGITIAGGNVAFDQQVENALYTVEVYSADYHVPIYKGYEGPMLRFGNQEHATVEDVHGDHGMGDSKFDPVAQRPEADHAVDFIIDTVKKHPEEISLLAIAPLTNIAMAIQKDPSITKAIKHLYIMGGTNNSLGNITAAAEYNFYVDPEAARIVLHSGIPMTMVGWDMCVDYSVMSDDNHQEIAALNTTLSDFFTAVNGTTMRFNKKVHKIDGTTHPDTLLVAVAADETIMETATEYYVDIETQGELTRGYSMVDINNRSGHAPNIRVCKRIDREKFQNHLYEVLASK